MTTPAETHPVHIGWRSRLAHPPTLAICGVALVVLTVIVWNSIAARQSVRIPLTGDLSQQPAHEVAATFKSLGIESVTVRDGFLVVAASDEARCRQFLQESTVDHATWADEWQRANEQLNPFSSASERSAAREIARARRISQMLSGMPGVQHADVVWDEQTGHGFRRESTVRATVYIRPKTDCQLTSQMVESIREAVAGSKANLAADDVIVMDLSTGMTHRVAAAMADEVPPLVTESIEDSVVETQSSDTASPRLNSMLDLDRMAQLEWLASMPTPRPTMAQLLYEELDGGMSSSVIHSPRFSTSYSSLYPAYDDPIYSSTIPHRSNLLTESVVDYASSQNPGIPRETLRAQSPIEVAPDKERDSETAPLQAASTPMWSTEIIEPSRDRASSTVEPVSRDSASNAVVSRNDFRFFVWIVVGVIALIAVMRGLRGEGDVSSPELTITARPPLSEPAADVENQNTRLSALNGPVAQLEHVDTNSSRSLEVSSQTDGASIIEPESSLNQDADPLAAFEHLGWLEAESIQKLYRCLPDEPWALALSGASTQIQEHVLKSLSRSTSMMLQKRMDSLPAIRLRDVEDAQRRLGEWVGKLDETAESL